MPRNRPPGSKYQPLAAYLAAQPVDDVTLNFAQIVAIVRTPLPEAAYGPQWWLSPAAHYARSRPWRAVGWEAVAVTPRAGERWVTIVRRR